MIAQSNLSVNIPVTVTGLVLMVQMHMAMSVMAAS